MPSTVMYWLELVATPGACAKLIPGSSKREQHNQIVGIDIIKEWSTSKRIEAVWDLKTVSYSDARLTVSAT